MLLKSNWSWWKSRLNVLPWHITLKLSLSCTCKQIVPERSFH